MLLQDLILYHIESFLSTSYIRKMPTSISHDDLSYFFCLKFTLQRAKTVHDEGYLPECAIESFAEFYDDGADDESIDNFFVGLQELVVQEVEGS